MAIRGTKLLIVGLVIAVSLAAFVLLRLRPASCEFEVYGFTADAPVQELLAKLKQESPASRVVVHDLAQRDHGEHFSRALAVINTSANIPLLPDSVERRAAPPYIHFHNQNRYYGEYTSSLVGAFCNGSLLAVVIGDWYGEGFWGDLLAQGNLTSGARVFAPSGIHEITDERIIAELSALLRGSAND